MSSDQFSVGEVAIGQKLIFSVEKNGMECEIIGGLMMRTGRPRDRPNNPPETKLTYLVKWADGDRSNVSPYNLRRRKPPTTGEASILAMFLTSPQKKGVTA